MSKPKPQAMRQKYLQDGLGFVEVVLGGLFSGWFVWVFLHKVKMKNLVH